jgi:hypothetical protein
MHKLFILFITFCLSSNLLAQETSSSEKYGKTLNLGAGIGYYGYLGRTLPVGMLNFEFDVAKNFTLAPFIGIYSHRNYYYWGNPNKPNWDESYRRYSYKVTSIPVGLKGTYYFDELLHANSKWDFYAAASLGFVFRSVVWENNYYGDRQVYKSSSPLYLDAHIGTEYHLNKKLGLFLDLSTGLSTFGLAIHL